ncbi:MAG: biotin-dependent carboxyltransferase family protein [Pontibacterium sp.]
MTLNKVPSEGFKVRQPGLMTLIQDAGRFGQHGIGLTCGGPLDADAFSWANRLCDNRENTTALEVSFGGLVLEAQVQTRLAVTGAALPLRINGQEKSLWRSHVVKAGDLIELGYATEGCRAYLAVAGGFQIQQSFGSAATVTRESVGGLNGGKLLPNDFLPCLPASASGCLVLTEKHQPSYGQRAHIRVIPGYQKQAFTDLQLARFFSSEYQTTDRSDRMGYRLNGPEIKPSLDGILSEGICHGAIQVPADGQPIVLLNDRQTIGGYPKLGSAISLDTAKLSQLTPGAVLTFEAITIDDAHNLHWLAKRRTSAIALRAC